MNQDNQQKSSRTGHYIMTVIGVFLCVIFGFMLICNLTIIIKGTINPLRPPSVLGITPMAVLSGSMSGDAEDHIEVGDLIFITQTNAKDLNVGDVIAFMEDGSTTVVTHRIIDITNSDDGQLAFITKGDANNAADDVPVSQDRLVGIYKFRIPKVGDFALFLQKPLGMFIFIGIPFFAFIIYDILRRQHYSNKERQQTAELQKELEKLRAMSKQNGSKNDEELN